MTTGIGGGIGLVLGLLVWFLRKDNLFWVWVLGGLFGGAIIGGIINYAIQGSKPNEPNRYKLRTKERRIYELKKKKKVW